MEAVHDENTKLSYHALVGSQKQSVSDVEQIFSERVLSFFESKSYTAEAEYVRAIRNWRRACDERGITDADRRQYNQEMLSYILDKLMPWHSQPGLHDFSLLEVNQYVKSHIVTTACTIIMSVLYLHVYRDISNIRGFSRETLSALIVDIESREWRRRFNRDNCIPPEHPRASTTDDVECFF